MKSLSRIRPMTHSAEILLCAASLIFVVPLMTACTAKPVATVSAGPTSHTPEDLRTHGEAVFRLQNAVLDQVIDADQDHTESTSTGRAALLAAEERIVRSCHALNEAASLGAQGLEPGLPLKLRVLKSMAGCENSALAVRAQLNPASAKVVTFSP